MAAPTCPIEGLIGEISVGGTFIGWLMGVTLNASRAVTPIRGMGTYEASCLLKGIVNYEGSFKRAFMCADMLDLFRDSVTTGGAEFAGSFYPRGTAACGTISGSLVFTSWSLTGWEYESEAAKVTEMDFVLYAVSTP